MRRLFNFHGGLHPPGNKAQSTAQPIVRAPVPQELVIPLRQHAGEAAKPLVQVGERVLKGQLIGAPVGGFSASIHAPTSGTVSAIDLQSVAHPSALPELCITLRTDGAEEWGERHPVDYRTLSNAELQAHLRAHGIVGLGGAAFPSDMKLRHALPVQTLILNGAECEPYITCDDMLMRERAAEIVRGAEILRFALDAREVLIGIEDNKAEAAAAMQNAVNASGLPFEVVVIPTLYPSGSAKHLIRILTGLEVPSGKLPTDIGVQCFNVGTTYAVKRACDDGEPLIARVVTVTGNVAQPRNYEALIGTRFAELVQLSAALPDTDRYLMGGPMMGLELPAANVPLVKASNCVIAASDALFPPKPPALPCIRCTRCAQVCPAELQPQDLYWFAQSNNFGKAQEWNLFDCIECGACAYVCPSSIPLVHYYRYAKSEVRARDQEKRAADQARERHEFHQLRIEREKQEKAGRLAQKERESAAKAAAAIPAPAAALNPAASADDTQQMRIDAAIERAKAQAAVTQPKNVGHLTPEQQAEIAAIEARRANLHKLAADAGADDEPPKSS
ncbi:electron transport complex subunit RsxC [Ferrigenium sp. UT5]|uniref:electron transport complex subunit RsxC n=1 Tax=Ferrigenium sp. UT5 TaxID=3242105 RepID=UPI003552D1AD